MPTATRVRPTIFNCNLLAPLARGLVFAGLGNAASTYKYVDSSGYDNHGTLTGMDPRTDWVYVDELGRMATDYDGSNDQVVLTGGFPDLYWYAFWLRYTSTSGTHTIINSVLSGSYTISLDHTRAQLSGGANNGPAASLDYIPVNVWTHIVIYPQLVNAGGVIFVNGVDRTVNATDYVGVADANCIGACSWRYFYLGRLADVLVWNRALAPAEIAALADTSNVMLEYAGVPLIGPRPRRWWPIGAAPPAGIPWVYAHSRSAAVIGAH